MAKKATCTAPTAITTTSDVDVDGDVNVNMNATIDVVIDRPMVDGSIEVV